MGYRWRLAFSLMQTVDGDGQNLGKPRVPLVKRLQPVVVTTLSTIASNVALSPRGILSIP